MKKALLFSLATGVVLTLVGLVNVSGVPPPMPPQVQSGVDQGVEALTPAPAEGAVKGHRGFPLAVMYLQHDNDGNSVYEGYSIVGTVGDVAIYSLVVFGISKFVLQKAPAKTSKRHK